MLNTAPRFAEPKDDTVDFTGFMDEFVAQDPVIQLHGLKVEIREIRLGVEGEQDWLNWDDTVQITGPGGEIVLVSIFADLVGNPSAALIQAVASWLDDHEREIYAWAREQVEG